MFPQLEACPYKRFGLWQELKWLVFYIEIASHLNFKWDKEEELEVDSQFRKALSATIY